MVVSCLVGQTISWCHWGHTASSVPSLKSSHTNTHIETIIPIASIAFTHPHIQYKHPLYTLATTHANTHHPTP